MWSCNKFPVIAVTDLLEVVDRRAKSVATELSDEQTAPQPSGKHCPVLVSARRVGILVTADVCLLKDRVAKKGKQRGESPGRRLQLDRLLERT